MTDSKPLLVMLALLVALGALAACKPTPASAPPLPPLVGWSIDVAFPEDNLNATARCIVAKESGGNTLATNGIYRGIWQLGPNYDGSLSVTHDGDWRNPLTSSLVARQILDSRGNWSAWEVAPRCGVR